MKRFTGSNEGVQELPVGRGHICSGHTGTPLHRLLHEGEGGNDILRHFNVIELFCGKKHICPQTCLEGNFKVVSHRFMYIAEKYDCGVS